MLDDEFPGGLVAPKIGVSQPARFSSGRDAGKPSPSGMHGRFDVDEAIPDHLVRVPSRPCWMRVVEDHPDAQHRRADWWRNTLAVVWQVATRTGPDRVTSPLLGATWDVLAEGAGVSRRTLADRISWLRECGFLTVLTSGSTVRWRPGTMCGLLDDGLGNLAAEYILTVPAEVLAALDEEELQRTFPVEDSPAVEDWRDVPWPVETLPVDLTRTPSCSPRVSLSKKSDAFPDAPARSVCAIPRPKWSATATPGTKQEMLVACELLRAEDALLRKLTALQLRSLLRVLFRAGATVRDVGFALNHEPDGRPWTVSRDLFSIPGWVRWRVRTWVDDDGTLKARLPSQVTAAADWARRKRQAERDAERRRSRVLRVDAEDGHAALVRAELDAARARLAARNAGAA